MKLNKKIFKYLFLTMALSFLPLDQVTISNHYGSTINLNMITKAYAKKKKRRRWPRTFALNFKDVEISEFISVMSQLIKKNIILSDKVRGKI